MTFSWTPDIKELTWVSKEEVNFYIFLFVRSNMTFSQDKFMVFPWKSFHKALTIGTSYIVLEIFTRNFLIQLEVKSFKITMFRIFMTLSFRTSLYFFMHDSIAYPESWQCKLPRVVSCEGHTVHKIKKFL